MAYPTVDDLRAEGLTDEMCDDTKATALLAEAVDIVERYCRRKFVSYSDTVLVDSNGETSLWLPDAIISITTVTERRTETEIPSTEYGFTGRELYLDLNSPDFTGNYGSLWEKGDRAYSVVCDMGMSDTPADISRAIILWVLHNALAMMEEDGSITPEADRIIAEKIDQYSYQLDDSQKSGSSYTGVHAVDRILNRWRRPMMGVAVR